MIFKHEKICENEGEMMRLVSKFCLSWLLSFFVLSTLYGMEVSPDKIGIVIMHGKGGSPTRLVKDMAMSLEDKGYLIANLEMPWSKKRDYDVDIPMALKEVAKALSELQAKGAKKLFVAGHSQGGLFALCVAGDQRVDGIIAIAPGGNVGNATFREKLGLYVEDARKLIEQGKGDEKTTFADFENAKGVYSIVTTPRIYLSWFDPDGAFNQENAIKKIDPNNPILYIVPTHDYAGLLKVKETMYDALPKHPSTKLYSPKTDHVGAPSASVEQISTWINKLSNP